MIRDLKKSIDKINEIKSGSVKKLINLFPHRRKEGKEGGREERMEGGKEGRKTQINIIRKEITTTTGKKKDCKRLQ